MSTRRRPSVAGDHLNRDAYIFLSILAGEFAADIEKVCAERELTEGHYRVLWVLCLSGDTPVPMGTVIDGVINKASDTTRLVDKLVRLGMVTRSPSPTDRRSVLVGPTALGRRTFAALTERIKAVHYDQWGSLSADEMRTLISLLRKARLGGDARGKR